MSPVLRAAEVVISAAGVCATLDRPYGTHNVARRESALEAWACSWARYRGIVVAKLAEVDGIPDRIFFVPGGSPIIVEFKRLNKRGKGLQEDTQPWYLTKLRKDGYTVYHCDTKDQFRELMKEYKECRISAASKPSTKILVISKTKTSKR